MNTIHFANMGELQSWLERQGLNVVAWGKNSKHLEHLWAEWVNGEFDFQENPPLRLIQVVQLIIRRGNQVLVEAEQELADGGRRVRGQPPSEKIKRGEDYLAAAVRCCQEELGVTSQRVTLLPETYQCWEKTAESLSYPGLMTHYTFHSLEAQINHLPKTDFWRKNHAHAQGDPVKRHRWGWRRK